MSEDRYRRARYGEAFWRAHHEAWKRSDLNQREYCASQSLSLKAFGNWRAKFKAEPEVPARKLLWRRGGVSHTLGHTSSHTPGHMTYPSSGEADVPVVPPARDGHRRRFSDAQRTHILAEAARPGASVSEVARRFGIAWRVLCRWRQEEAVRFMDVEIIDGEVAP